MTDALTANPPEHRQAWQRGFWCLFATQFQGAFSDNVFKMLVIFIISRHFTPAERDQMMSIVLVLFSLPFIIFAMAGGHMADRFSKRNVVVGVKLAEIAVMALGTIALATEQMWLLLTVIFLMSTQSAFFSPSKYGLLPEMLPESKLSWGNGILGLGTFVAIIGGAITAGVLSDQLGNRQLWSGLILVALAAIGVATSLGLPRLTPADPQRIFRINFVSELWRNVRLARGDRILTLAILGSTYFWFIGALFDPTIVPYGKDLLALNDTQISSLKAALAIGIGVGSAAAGMLSAGKIEYGLVPLGAIGLTVFAALLGIPGMSIYLVAGVLALIGFAGGFFIVPLNALVQQRPDRKHKGTIIATTGWFTSFGVFASAGTFWVMKSALSFSAPTIFLCSAGLTLVCTVVAVRAVPDSLLRLLFWMLTRTVYRLTITGRDNLPERGGALIVCNHVSYVDAFLLMAATDRQIRFVMHRNWYERKWIRPMARAMRAIPIASDLPPRLLVTALQQARDELAQGEAVAVFAEGQLSLTGQVLPFQRGLEQIAKGTDAPIIPVHLGGVWGSIFSFERGRFLWKLPRHFPYPVDVRFGQPLPATTAAAAVRQAVLALGADAWAARPSDPTLPQAMLATARRRPRQIAFSDPTGDLTYGDLAQAVRGRGLALEALPATARIGVMLPPGNQAVIELLGIVAANRTAVMLDPSWPEAQLQRCLAEARLSHLVSEQDHDGIPRLALATSTGSPPGRALPCGLRKAPASAVPAIEVFDEGGALLPLTQAQLAANAAQLSQVFPSAPDDVVLGCLPLASGVGLVALLAYPLYLGLRVDFRGESAGPALVPAGPRQVTDWLASGALPVRDPRALVVCGGSDCRPLAESAATAFGVPAYWVFGSAAALAIAIGRAEAETLHTLPGVAIRVRAADGSDLGVDQPGDLWLRSPASADPSGWQRTTWQARLDTDGRPVLMPV